MADFLFDPADIASLAQKLNNAKQQLGLTEQEYNLLLLIFAAAAARVEVVDDQTGRSSLPNARIVGQAVGPGDAGVALGNLKDQLLNAYIPGNYFLASDPRLANTRGDQSPPAKKPPAGEGG